MPEGFYQIDRFNPKSEYHLSLGLNYPNAADLALGEPDPGGDIFIHGGEVTIGCLPITDIGIEEVYLIAVAARAAGQTLIPVHIFPFPLTESELARRTASPNYAFWRGCCRATRISKSTTKPWNQLNWRWWENSPGDSLG
ncbi:murein L,D-transpeptidase family protein [Hymenobacter humi]|uniref:Murein L,D-transpeptidase family protein n=1 Tax=Hymenobacter humi TaxID=1411620 RepID=A0ABW2U496_9BACT